MQHKWAKLAYSWKHTHTHTRPFNGPFSGTTQVSRYQKSKTNLDFTEARDSEWQWHQLGHMQVCTSLQTDNHASTPPLSFLQAGCSSCRPTNSVKALKAKLETAEEIPPLYNGVTIAERHSSGILPTDWHDANNKDKGSANENDKFLYNTERSLSGPGVDLVFNYFSTLRTALILKST